MVVDRVVVERERAPFADLVGPAQVDHRAQPELADHLEIGTGEAVQAVGAVQRPPPGGATVGGGISTKVTEVVHRLEHDEAVGVRTHVGQGIGCHAIDGSQGRSRSPDGGVNQG